MRGSFQLPFLAEPDTAQLPLTARSLEGAAVQLEDAVRLGGRQERPVDVGCCSCLPSVSAGAALTDRFQGDAQCTG
jgi:hypothetical protein